MRIAKISIDRPVTTIMFTLAVVLLGFVSLRQLGVDLLPDISYPRLSVVTQFSGVAPEDVETLVTAPLESAVSRIPGLRRVSSISKEGVSFLSLEFAWGTDMDFALLHAREKLDNARHQLPQDAERPVLIPLDPQSRPIMVVAVGGEAALLDLKEFAEDLIKPRLEQIDGIASAEVAGGDEREIHVEVDPSKLALHGLTIAQVSSRLQAENQNLQGGTVYKDTFRYALRVVGEFTSVKEIGDITLKTTRDRGVVRLRDVAAVDDGVKEREGAVRLDARESVGLLVRKEAGANTVKVTRLAREVLAEIGRQYPEVGLTIVSEEAGFIEEAVSSVKDEIIQGGLLAFIVLLLFLQEFRTASLIFAVIAVSVIATFNLMFFGGLSLNIMSLGGLALGVGMLDDCAIVVTENIFRHRRLGKPPAAAAYVGVKEVGMAVSATIFTTIVVFLPVLYVHGIAGQLFKDQALTVTFALLASLAASLTLVPMLTAKLYRSPGERAAAAMDAASAGADLGGPAGPRPGKLRRGLRAVLRAPGRALTFAASFLTQLAVYAAHVAARPFRTPGRAIGRRFTAFYERFVDRYHRALVWSLDHKGRVIAVSLVVLAATGVAATLIPRELMPRMRVDTFELHLRAPVEYAFDQTDDLVRAVEAALAPHPGVRTFFSQTGIVSGLEAFSPDVSANTAVVRVEASGPREMDAVIEDLRSWFESFPDVERSFVREQTTMAQFLTFASAELSLHVRGDELDTLKEIAVGLADRLRPMPGLADVQVGLEEGKPELLLKVRKDALERHGISPSGVAAYMVDAVRGRSDTQFKQIDRKYDILVRLEEGSRLAAEALLAQNYLHEGRLVPLRELVETEIARGPREIRRENQQREMVVTANLRGGRGRIMADVQKVLDDLVLPRNYRVVLGGEQEEMTKSFRSLVFAFLVAALLTYMIMAAQFESLLHPFLIMFTLPMGAVGTVALLGLTGQTFNVISVIGVVVLVGIVTDNAIVKIDFTNQLRREGMPLRAAVLEGSAVRLRPIIMSTATTIFGLLPLALGLGRGAELQRPLGIAVIGGLLSSTFLTLILIPVLYEILESRREKRRAAAAAETGA